MISAGPSVKRLARFVNGYPFRPDQLVGNGLPVVRIRQLVDPTAELEFADIPPGAVIIDDGDLVFSWSGTLAVVRWERGRALLNQHLFRVDPHPGIDPRWLGYVLQEGIQRLAPLMHGSAMTHITQDMLNSLTVRVPASREQQAIADYLDTETARIDSLIAKRRRIRHLLEERRMAVMTQGVSGSLTSASVEASRLNWVITRGAGWREAKLTLVAHLGSGHTPSREHPEWWVDCEIPWITTGEVAQMRSDRIEFITRTRERISEIGIANSAAEVHPAGTVVLCRTASAGYSAIMGTDMTTSQDFATWTCGPLLGPRFLLLCLRVMRQDLLGRLAMGSTHKTIYMPDIEALRIPLPALQEQHNIVEAVWSRLYPIDLAVDAIEEQVALLRQHRQGLITATVTGEADGPGVAA